MSLPKKIKLVEVGPRDGLQNQGQFISTRDKTQFINMLSECGYQSIETTSFVSPKWVPQMADHKEVYESIYKKKGVTYPVLIPNMRGLDAALAAGVKEIAIFTAASEAFTQKNIHCSINESFLRFQPVVEKALQHKMKIRGYVSTVIACPYAGDIAPYHVAYVAKRLFDLGCYEISLGDTMGVGTADKVKQMIHTVAGIVPLAQLAGHFHDTFSQALTNIYASLEMGMTVFDSSVSGLGGCPYAKGASGNVATEDVLYMMRGLSIETGIVLDKVIEASIFIDRLLARPHGSKVTIALLSQQKN